MWIVAIAWMYVATMMTVAEAASPQGSVLAAIGIFFFYGLLPTALVMYLLNTPTRRRARLAKEAKELHELAHAQHGSDLSLGDTDARSLSASDALSSKREKNIGV